MPDDPSSDASLGDVLRTAQKAMARGDGWDMSQGHYDRIRADFDAIGISGTDLALTLALRNAFSEITSADLRRRPDPSYSGLADGQTLYDCRWQSPFFSREMYIKFAVTDGGIEIITCHENVTT